MDSSWKWLLEQIVSLEREKSQTHSLYQPDCVCASFLNVSSLYCYIYFSLSLFMFFFRSNKISIQMLLLLGKFVLNEDRRQAFRGNFFFVYFGSSSVQHVRSFVPSIFCHHLRQNLCFVVLDAVLSMRIYEADSKSNCVLLIHSASDHGSRMVAQSSAQCVCSMHDGGRHNGRTRWSSSVATKETVRTAGSLFIALCVRPEIFSCVRHAAAVTAAVVVPTHIRWIITWDTNTL